MSAREWDHRIHHSWPSMLDAVAHGETPNWLGTLQSRDASHGHSWTLGMDFDAALRLVQGFDTWDEGRRDIEEQAREQAERFVCKRGFIDYGFDNTGEFFDMPSVIEGRPECWLRPEYSNAGSPALVRLVIDLGTSGGVSAETIKSRMTSICAAALTLEACGNPVEVIGCSASQGIGSYLISYQVSTAGMPLDVQRLVALAHPAFFRRIVFRMIEQTSAPIVYEQHAHGYGECPRSIPDDVLAHEFGTHVVYVPPCDVYTQSAPTVERLLEMVKMRAGVVASDDYREAI